MLQGLVYDMEGTLYGPVFTSRHDRQYCYYVSQNIKQDRDHPNNIMARLPGHDLETTVERALRQEMHKFTGEEETPVIEHILELQQNIPTYDLVRTFVERASIGLNRMMIRVKTSGFQKLAEKHLDVKTEGHDETFEVTVSFKMGKAKKGAIVIRPEGAKDMLDLPLVELKKLVQGVVWREEHFAGKTLTEIAQREGCSGAHIGKLIM